jgi:hypothetical protein
VRSAELLEGFFRRVIEEEFGGVRLRDRDEVLRVVIQEAVV